MRLTFLGTGSAFTCGDNYQSNMLLEAPSGRKLLIDAGSDVRWPLTNLGIRAADIHEIYISHLHGDHIGGLEWLGFSTYFAKAPRPVLNLSGQLVAPLWEDSLKGGMGSIEGQIARLETFFDVRPVPPNGGFTFEGVKFTLIRVVHVMDGFDLMPCYGLLFTLNGIRVFLTTDTQFTNHLEVFYEKADVVFHDCETSPHRTGVHAHYDQLRTLPERYRAKMWLYHHNGEPLPAAKGDGFRGFVAQGQVFDFTEPETLKGR
jgi:ribonuclease BN (tRNA processing enzyme)